MGDFRIEIEGSGTHGCARNAKPGGPPFYGCGKMGCVDCELRRFLSEPSFRNAVRTVVLIHYPDTPNEVIDEYTVIDGRYVQGRRIKGDLPT